ncbi:MAG: hypothetical protein AAF560_23255 [Acidobacteriota bacterium]
MKRLWIDANVILRFLTGEPPELHQRSVELIEKAERRQVKLCVSEVVPPA